MLEVGSVIRDKYEVRRVLGSGGMGVVFEAWHTVLHQRVAIKVLRPELMSEPEIVARFVREGRAAARLESDHVARVLDVDILDDGTPFIVMEHLEGRDLSFVRRSGPLKPAVAVAYVLQALDAISEAHGLGIVHRDIKPANLFLARRRDGSARVKLLDFGISKLSWSGPQPSVVTCPATVMGTPEYISPEQMLTPHDIDHRTDIWSIGVTLYELCTARVPFDGDNLTTICAQVLASIPVAPSSFQPQISTDLDRIILRCLERDPRKRFESVAALAVALGAHAGAGSSLPPTAMTESGDEQPDRFIRESSTTAGLSRVSTGPIRHSRVPRLAAALFVGALGAALAIASAFRRDLGPNAPMEPAIATRPVASAPIVTPTTTAATPSIGEVVVLSAPAQSAKVAPERGATPTKRAAAKPRTARSKPAAQAPSAPDSTTSFGID